LQAVAGPIVHVEKNFGVLAGGDRMAPLMSALTGIAVAPELHVEDDSGSGHGPALRAAAEPVVGIDEDRLCQLQLIERSPDWYDLRSGVAALTGVARRPEVQGQPEVAFRQLAHRIDDSDLVFAPAGSAVGIHADRRRKFVRRRDDASEPTPVALPGVSRRDPILHQKDSARVLGRGRQGKKTENCNQGSNSHHLAPHRSKAHN
jgi:hypothetical protein